MTLADVRPRVGYRLREYIRLFPLRIHDSRFWIIQAQVFATMLLHIGLEASGVSEQFEGLHHLPLLVYLIPIIYAALNFQMEGGLLTAAEAVALSLPNLPVWHSTDWAWIGELIQLSTLMIVGITVSWLVESEGRARRATEAASHRLAAVHAITDFATRSDGLTELLQTTATLLSESTGAPEARIRFAPAKGDEVTVSYPPSRISPLALDAPSLAVEAMRDGSVVAVPLITAERGRGVISLRLSAAQPPEDIESLLEAVAHELAASIDRVMLGLEERRAIEALRSSEERYRRLFEESQEAILALDQRGVVRAANRSAQSLLGDEPVWAHPRFQTVLADAMRSLQGGSGEGEREVDIEAEGRELTLAALWSRVELEDGSRGLQMLIRDVTAERRERALLRRYAHDVTRAQEEERKRIARELHDDVAQALMLVLRGIREVSRRIDQDVRADMSGVERQVEQVVQDVRRFGRELRPSVLDDLGLTAALQWLVDALNERSDMQASLTVIGERRELSADLDIVVFRVCQESLRNAERHAGASHVSVTLIYEPAAVTLEVHDNGEGFDTGVTDRGAARGMGIVGMRERVSLAGGRFEIRSSADRGTRIRAVLPNDAWAE